jgi:hypothetical protein
MVLCAQVRDTSCQEVICRGWIWTREGAFTDTFCCGSLGSAQDKFHRDPQTFRASLGRRLGEGGFQHDDSAVGLAAEGGGVGAEEFAAPPCAGRALCGEVGEPVLPDDRAHFGGRRATGERIGGEE